MANSRYSYDWKHAEPYLNESIKELWDLHEFTLDTLGRLCARAGMAGRDGIRILVFPG